ncbi:hypothetical protein HGM15179_018577 [Zosterops borbonicus]|uniref:Uncharacterized protein n=1 Tax=Zosterops borbonicus TaxID=364589 RepID=A0A8K1FYH6_9PASS|nr:hypothetical protein HGM15179_018577 [Zosterops borbonicus]
MGSGASQEQKDVAEMLEWILQKHSRKVESTYLNRLFFWAKDCDTTLDTANIFDLQTWDALGDVLWDRVGQGGRALVELLCSRQTVCSSPMVHVTPRDRKKKDTHGTATAVLDLQAPVPSEPTPALPAPTTPAPSSLLLQETQDFDCKSHGTVGGELEGGPWSPDPLAPGREPDIFPPDWWAVVKKQAAVEGDAYFLHVFPVIYQPHQLPRWESLPYGVRKEMRCSAMDNGISAPFTTSLLETVVNSYNLAPQD